MSTKGLKPGAWAVAFGAVAWVIATVLCAVTVDLGSSSTAALGILFAPIAGLFYAVPAALFGFSLGHLVAWRREGLGRVTLGAAIAFAAALLVMAAAASEISIGLRRSARDQRLRALSLGDMEPAALETFLRDSPDRDDQCALALIAESPHATGPLLDIIARKTDPALHRKAPGCLGHNRQGLAVMRLVARNANVLPETLEWLAQSSDDYVLGDIAHNPKLSTETLRRLSERHSYLIDWGLGANPSTPGDLLDRLAESPDRYTRVYVAGNPSTPADTRRRLMEQHQGN